MRESTILGSKLYRFNLGYVYFCETLVIKQI